MTFLDRRYEKLMRLDSITCVVDAEALFAHGDDERLLMLKLRQIGFADLVILNKVDLVGPEHVEVVRDWISLQLKRIRILEAVQCDVPLEILLGVGRFHAENLLRDADNAGREEPEHHHRHAAAAHMFDTWSYESDRPFSLQALREMVRRELPESIYRCKGIVFAADTPGKRLSLQAVGRRTEITELDDWGERTPCNRIVAIGAAIDTQSLSSKFDSCVAEPGNPAHYLL